MCERARMRLTWIVEGKCPENGLICMRDVFGVSVHSHEAKNKEEIKLM